MESRETLAALSEGMADAVARAGRSVVRVHGRRRHPGSGVVFAEDLVLSVRTVDNHVRNLYAKLGVHDRAQAALSAARLGLITMNGS